MKAFLFKLISKRFPIFTMKVARAIVGAHGGLKFTYKQSPEYQTTIGELLTDTDKLVIECKMKGLWPNDSQANNKELLERPVSAG